MFIYCRRYPKDKSEAEVQSVFDHWMRCNEKDPSYGEMRSKMGGRKMTVKRMATKMEWAYFAPISIDERYKIPAQ